jgi:REP element-mobilizing transposase RayT
MKTDSIKEFVGIIQQFNANLKQHLPALEPEIDAMLSGMSPMVMPNHFHVILHIAPVGAPLVGAPNYVGAPNAMDTGRPQGHAPTGRANKTVGDMMGAFKSITTVHYIHGVKTMGWEPFNGKFWQRNYHEHIIRNEQSHQTISDYIIINPAKWASDILFQQ